METYQISYLSSGRDIGDAFEPDTSNATYVFADPDFDLPLGDVYTNEGGPVGLGSSELYGVKSSRSREWKRTKFHRLIGTSEEAAELQRILQLDEEQLFLGRKATEKNLLSLVSPRRLHVATHGFFLKDQEDIQALVWTAPSIDNSHLQRQVAQGFENPMLRSGLALARANLRMENRLNDTNDGIVTALEISSMNLHGTDLVVLSACETGLGDVQIGEGVFGLRRAFQLAGAKTIVMSLWKVPDVETVLLMQTFYNKIREGESASKALREASLHLLTERRNQDGAAHPYYWAAFVCFGAE